MGLVYFIDAIIIYHFTGAILRTPRNEDYINTRQNCSGRLPVRLTPAIVLSYIATTYRHAHLLSLYDID